jgi:lysylphosphatidylglycerol synthetase-like protein (DUF2156 family)
MVAHLVGLLEALVLSAIAVLHVYWALGGRWGADVAVPSREHEATRAVFTPPPAVTLVVAGLLAGAALVALEGSGWTRVLPAWMATLGIWVLSVVFALRSIGEFRYVGLFKRVRNTPFARLDSSAFTPLTIALSLSSVLIALS